VTQQSEVARRLGTTGGITVLTEEHIVAAFTIIKKQHYASMSIQSMTCLNSLIPVAMYQKQTDLIPRKFQYFTQWRAEVFKALRGEQSKVSWGRCAGGTMPLSS
jgi:hypothetical protein